MVRTHLLDCFEETIAQRSGHIAVRHNDQWINFKELGEKAQKTGAYLLSQIKETTNTPIAVFLPKEINTIIADLGILYSSNPFMNLDVKTPKERIMNIFELVKPAAVVTSRKFVKNLPDVAVPVIFIDALDWGC